MRASILSACPLFTSILSTQPPPADSVLLIIAEDLGRDSLASFNDDLSASLTPTHTLDGLVDIGIRFDRIVID